jgi:hypothetical protein
MLQTLVWQTLLLQQCVLHVDAAHETPALHTFEPLHSMSHDAVALHATPAAHDVPVWQSTTHVAPPQVTLPF